MKRRFPFKVHPAADMFPYMSEQELEELARDIAEKGQLDPILMCDGELIDGRNRYFACEMAGVDPKFEEWKGVGSPIGAIISRNLRRRELNTVQKSFFGAEAARLYAEDTKERQREHGNTAPGRKAESIIQEPSAGCGDGSGREAFGIRGITSGKAFPEFDLQNAAEKSLVANLATSVVDDEADGAIREDGSEIARSNARGITSGKAFPEFDLQNAAEKSLVANLATSVRHGTLDPDIAQKARDKAARLVGVSPRYIQIAKNISDRAPEVARFARAGKLTLPQAKMLANLPESQRKAVIESLEKNPLVKPREIINQAKAEWTPAIDHNDDSESPEISPDMPEPVRKALDEGPVFKAMLNDVRKLKHKMLTQLKAYQDSDRTEMRLATGERQELEAAFEVVERLIKLRMTPFGECPYCKANGHKADCRVCHGCGWLPKSAYEAGVRAVKSNIAIIK